MKKELLGELVGTFILVLFGCGAVAGAVTLGAFGSLLEVAIIWGMGVAVAIFVTRNWCPAHLNPAVTLGMAIANKFPIRKVPAYVIAQLIGAIGAACMLYFLFHSAIGNYESLHGVIRGEQGSHVSAQMFGEFFPNPGFEHRIYVSWIEAMLIEGFGTFILLLAIFKLTEKEDQINNTTPIAIGLTLTILICLLAPFTQAGFNPARDFGPRVVAYFLGWGSEAFTAGASFATVYIVGPILGAGAAGLIYRFKK